MTTATHAHRGQLWLTEFHVCKGKHSKSIKLLQCNQNNLILTNIHLQSGNALKQMEPQAMSCWSIGNSSLYHFYHDSGVWTVTRRHAGVLILPLIFQPLTSIIFRQLFLSNTCSSSSQKLSFISSVLSCWDTNIQNNITLATLVLCTTSYH
jgi:hypothetical protein